MAVDKVRLYKYTTTERLFESIKNNRLYLDNGSNFNDPFELIVINNETRKANRIQGLHILCLTNSHSNKLMWSHYSKSHEGVCLTVEVPKHLVYPVCYTSNRVYSNTNIDNVIKNALINGKKNLKKNYGDLSYERKVALIKDKKWFYEKEHRIVFDKDSEHGLINKEEKWYMSVKFTNIYLGVNFDKESNNDIIELCKEKKITIKQMLLSNDKYALAVKEL